MSIMSLLTSLIQDKRGSSPLEQLAGTLLGGQKHSTAKNTTLVVLGSLAFKAYQKYQEQNTRNESMETTSQLMAGLKEPETPEEEHALHSRVLLMLKAMINAAKADGHIDEQEMDKIVGKAKENGLSDDEHDFIMAEINKPMDTDHLIASVSSPQIATQVYTASILAITNDTDAEQTYLNDLAHQLGLNKNTVSYLHATVGID